MLTVYKNGQEHTGYDNVPVRYSEQSHSEHGHSKATTTYEQHGWH